MLRMRILKRQSVAGGFSEVKRARKKPDWKLTPRQCSWHDCNESFYPKRQAQEYCSQSCRRDAAYGRERFESGTKGPRKRRLEASDKLPRTTTLGSFRSGHISSIDTVGYIDHFSCSDGLKPYVWPDDRNNPQHGLKLDGSTPGALQGDDYPLEYDADGYPILPACLDRRKTQLEVAA
jgi:hypothetical protein